jgi:hypothetical protein
MSAILHIWSDNGTKGLQAVGANVCRVYTHTHTTLINARESWTRERWRDTNMHTWKRYLDYQRINVHEDEKDGTFRWQKQENRVTI